MTSSEPRVYPHEAACGRRLEIDTLPAPRLRGQARRPPAGTMGPRLPAAAEAAERWPSTRLVVSATVAWALLAVELAVLAAYKVEIQSSFCGWAAWLRDTFALGDTVNDTLRHIHHKTDSFMYMQICCVFLLGTGKYTSTAAALYVYDVIAHMTKNFSKSFIASPRGFWFCTEGQAVSCGSGTTDAWPMQPQVCRGRLTVIFAGPPSMI